MAGLKLFIGTRKGNGQYGPASSEVDALKYLDILRDKGERRVLIDYAPLIEALHESHRLSNEQEIPDGQVKFPHPWPPQIPPGRTAGL